MEKIEIILRDNGTLTERTIRERDLKAEGDVLDELTADVTRSQRNVLAIPGWGVAHANVGLADTLWSVPINRIPLKARFKLVNSVLVPMFTIWVPNGNRACASGMRKSLATTSSLPATGIKNCVFQRMTYG